MLPIFLESQTIIPNFNLKYLLFSQSSEFISLSKMNWHCSPGTLYLPANEKTFKKQLTLDFSNIGINVHALQVGRNISTFLNIAL
jgi:hypothetical protein